MDNVISKGILLAASAGLVAYGLQVLTTNMWYGAGSIVLGCVLYVVREVLKKHGYSVSKMMKRGKK